MVAAALPLFLCACGLSGSSGLAASFHEIPLKSFGPFKCLAQGHLRAPIWAL